MVSMMTTDEWELIAAEQSADLKNPQPLDPLLVEWMADPRNFGPDADADIDADGPFYWEQ